jgi:hypothetical protein
MIYLAIGLLVSLLLAWINNDLALAWLKHFDARTKAFSAGAYRLLVIDGHESHYSVES